MLKNIPNTANNKAQIIKIAIKSILIFIIAMFNIGGMLYAGGNMNNVDRTSFYNELLELEKEKKWKMLTDTSERIESSIKRLFELCSLNPKNSKKIDISLYTPKEWPSKSIGSYALSPDGRNIAFVIYSRDEQHDWEGLSALYIMSIQDLKIETALPPKAFPDIKSICWSSDGRKIFFVGKLERIKESANTVFPQFDSLYSLDLQTKNIDSLVKYKVHTVNSQATSPDGSEIVFENNKREILVYNLKTKNIRKLGDGTWPTWSPSGKPIAFFGIDHNYYFINPDGSDKRLFIKNAGFSQWPRKFLLFGEKIDGVLGELLWSPDGKYIYFERSATNSSFDMVEYYVPYIMNVETKQEIRLPREFTSRIKSWSGNK